MMESEVFVPFCVFTKEVDKYSVSVKVGGIKKEIRPLFTAPCPF